MPLRDKYVVEDRGKILIATSALSLAFVLSGILSYAWTIDAPTSIVDIAIMFFFLPHFLLSKEVIHLLPHGGFYMMMSVYFVSSLPVSFFYVLVGRFFGRRIAVVFRQLTRDET